MNLWIQRADYLFLFNPVFLKFIWFWEPLNILWNKYFQVLVVLHNSVDKKNMFLKYVSMVQSYLWFMLEIHNLEPVMHFNKTFDNPKVRVK